MIIIFGGAYQGKLDFALSLLKSKNPKICNCTTKMLEIDFEADIIYALHTFLLGEIERNEDINAWLNKNMSELKDKVVICDDIFCGVVPMDKTMRKWREETGNTLKTLCNNADSVYRVFCGLETKLK